MKTVNLKEIPNPPIELEGDQLKWWKYIIEKNYTPGSLQPSDLILVAMTCQQISDHFKFREETEGNESFVTPKGYIAIHPLLSQSNKTIKNVLDLLKELGMTPKARKQFGSVVRKDGTVKDPFADVG